MSAATEGAVTARREEAEPSGLGRARLAWLQATHRRRPALALGICLLGAIALPALLPLVAAMAVETELTHRLAQDGGLSVQQAISSVDTLGSFQSEVDGRVSSQLGAHVVPLGAYVTTGPLNIVKVDSSPVTPGRPSVTAAFSDHLADHVVIVAGELPPDGLGGGTAITMASTGADQLGLRLSDQVCFQAQPADPKRVWCARLVGLWQPLDANDPYWTSGPPATQLLLGRYDFFSLAKLYPEESVTARLRYWADPNVINPHQAGDVATQARAAAASLAGPGRQVTTRLDTSLAAFATEQQLVDTIVQPFSVATALLGLLVVALVSARFMDGQAQGLAVLRARGWPLSRVWRVAFVGLAALAGWATLGAITASALVIGLLTATGLLSPLPLRPADLDAVGLAAVAGLVGLVLVLAGVAAASVRQEIEPSLDQPFRRALTWWERPDVTGILAVVALPAIVLPHVIDPQAPLLLALLALVSAVGVCLAAAALTSVRGALARGPHGGGVPAQLARWQLSRDGKQHAGAAFALLLASSLAAYAATEIGAVAAGGKLASTPTLQLGLVTVLVAGSVTALVVSLIGFGLHFAGIGRRRLSEYSGLFAHGLPVNQVARSMAHEQWSVGTSSIAAGLVLGVPLALATGAPGAPVPALAIAVAVGGAVVVAGFVAGVAIVATASRKVPADLTMLLQGPRS